MEIPHWSNEDNSATTDLTARIHLDELMTSSASPNSPYIPPLTLLAKLSENPLSSLNSRMFHQLLQKRKKPLNWTAPQKICHEIASNLQLVHNLSENSRKNCFERNIFFASSRAPNGFNTFSPLHD